MTSSTGTPPTTPSSDRARRDARRWRQAGIPYSLGHRQPRHRRGLSGGGACDRRRTRELVRDTTIFNQYFNRQSVNREGAYEAGKVDNTYHDLHRRRRAAGWCSTWSCGRAPRCVSWAEAGRRGPSPAQRDRGDPLLPRRQRRELEQARTTGRPPAVAGSASWSSSTPTCGSCSPATPASPRTGWTRGAHGNRIDTFLPAIPQRHHQPGAPGARSTPRGNR